MLSKEELKKIFHEVTAANSNLKKINSKDSLIVATSNELFKLYGNDDKNDAKDIALCIWYNYGFLYR